MSPYFKARMSQEVACMGRKTSNPRLIKSRDTINSRSAPIKLFSLLTFSPLACGSTELPQALYLALNVHGFLPLPLSSAMRFLHSFNCCSAKAVCCSACAGGDQAMCSGGPGAPDPLMPSHHFPAYSLPIVADFLGCFLHKVLVLNSLSGSP